MAIWVDFVDLGFNAFVANPPCIVAVCLIVLAANGFFLSNNSLDGIWIVGILCCAAATYLDDVSIGRAGIGVFIDGNGDWIRDEANVFYFGCVAA